MADTPAAGSGESPADVQETPDAPPPPAETARSVEEFDTTTEDQRREAVAPAENAVARPIGTTVVTLGDPTEPGFWIETPLVTEVAPGRVDLAGRSVAVTLRPIEGPATGGSRLSLAAMRLLNVPLTALPEVTVFLE